MHNINRILSVILSYALVATSAWADDAKCSDEIFKINHPDLCQSMQFFTTGTILGIGGGIAAVGGVAALIGMAATNSGAQTTPSSANTEYTISFRAPTLAAQTYLEFTPRASTTYTPTPEYNKNLAQYNSIGLGYAFSRGYTGQGSNIIIADDFHTILFSNHTHGDAVSYLASNVAPDAKIYEYDVASTNGSLNFQKFARIISESTTKNIYNISWEANSYATQATTRQAIEQITGTNFANAIANAANMKDSIFVVAAGNSGMSESSALSAIPIAIQEAQGHFINVVSYDTEKQTLADYSNQCGITMDYCITAPGTRMQTTDNKYARISGTSFAAPVVSGAVAILQQEFPYLNSNQITEILFRTATDIGETGVDSVYGWGLMNLDRATQPMGNLSVAISGNIVQKLSTATVSPTVAAAISTSNAQIAVFDEYGRAYTQPLNQNIAIENHGRGFDRLRRIDNIGQKTQFLEFGTSNINILSGSGFMQIDEAKTKNAFAAMNHSFNIGHTTIFSRASIGILSARPAPESVISNFSNIFTASATLGAKYNDLTFELAIPETIVSGTMDMTLAQGRTANGDIIFNNYNFNLVSTPAIEYAISYKNITAGFVDNPIGQDEFYILAKTKISF